MSSTTGFMTGMKKISNLAAVDEKESDMPDDEEPEDDDSFYSTTVLPDRCKLKITKWSFPPQLSHISAKSITPNVVSAIGEYIQEKKAFKELFHP